MILGSSKASGGKDVYFAPMTNSDGAAFNQDFAPGKSLDYMSGPKVEDDSRLHVGKPFKTDASNFQMLDPSHFTQTPKQAEDYHRDAKGNAKNPRPSAHESQTAEASTSQQQRGRAGSPGRGPSPSFRQQSSGGRGRSQSPCLLVPPTDTHNLDADAPPDLLVVDHQLPGVLADPHLTVNAHPLHLADKEDLPPADVVETEDSPKIPLAVVAKEDFPPADVVETEDSPKIPLAVVDIEDLPPADVTAKIPPVDAVETNLAAKVHRAEVEEIPLDAVEAEAVDDTRSNCWLPTLASDDAWMSSSCIVCPFCVP